MWLPADPSHRSNQALRGLSLVELLVAITLFAVLMAAVSWLIVSGARVQVAWKSSAEPYEQLERALNRLEQDVTSARPFFGTPMVVESQQLELARVDRLPVSEEGPVSDWLRITYHLAPESGGVSLIRQEFLWRKSGSGTEPLREETLVHLTTGQFAFGVADATTGALQWRTDWDGKMNGVPRLLKLDCTLAGAGGQPPVSLTRVIRNPAGTLPTVNIP